MVTDSIHPVGDPNTLFHVSLEFTLPESDDEETGTICHVWVGSTVVATITVSRGPTDPWLRANIDPPDYFPPDSHRYSVTLYEDERGA